MAVRFEVTLTDEEAQSVLDILNHTKETTLGYAAEEARRRTRIGDADSKWYREHADYLEGIISKVSAGQHKVQ